MKQDNSRFLKNHDSIKEKSLFFNTSEQEQIERLTSLLSTENLPSVQERLEEQGMRKGFAASSMVLLAQARPRLSFR